jgi:hypothetical protein
VNGEEQMCKSGTRWSTVCVAGRGMGPRVCDSNAVQVPEDDVGRSRERAPEAGGAQAWAPFRQERAHVEAGAGGWGGAQPRAGAGSMGGVEVGPFATATQCRCRRMTEAGGAQAWAPFRQERAQLEAGAGGWGGAQLRAGAGSMGGVEVGPFQKAGGTRQSRE